MFLWRRRAIRAAFERYTGPLGRSSRRSRADRCWCTPTSQLKPVSIDFAVMESAPGRARRDGLDGRRLVGHRQLDRAAGGLGGAGDGSVVQPGERVEVSADDLVVRRAAARSASSRRCRAVA